MCGPHAVRRQRQRCEVHQRRDQTTRRRDRQPDEVLLIDLRRALGKRAGRVASRLNLASLNAPHIRYTKIKKTPSP